MNRSCEHVTTLVKNMLRTVPMMKVDVERGSATTLAQDLRRNGGVISGNSSHPFDRTQHDVQVDGKVHNLLESLHSLCWQDVDVSLRAPSPLLDSLRQDGFLHGLGCLKRSFRLLDSFG